MDLLSLYPLPLLILKYNDVLDHPILLVGKVCVVQGPSYSTVDGTSIPDEFGSQLVYKESVPTAAQCAKECYANVKCSGFHYYGLQLGSILEHSNSTVGTS